MKYLIDENDKTLLAFFDAEFKATLPERNIYGGLLAELFDAETGIVYTVKVGTFYAEDWEEYWHEPSQMMVKVTSLHEYMYESHWCGCHRISSIEGSYPDAELVPDGPDGEEYCPDDRFFVKRVWAASQPDVILYAEKIPANLLK